MKHALIAGAAGVVAALAIVSGAFASPSNAVVISVDCGGGRTFQVVGYGNDGRSNFSAVHIIGTNQMAIAVALSNRVEVVTDPAGNTQTFTFPDVSHNAPANQDLMSCHYSGGASGPFGSFSFSGDVVAFIAGN